MNTKPMIHLSCAAMALALLASPAIAKPDKGQGKGKGGNPHSTSHKVDKQHSNKAHKGKPNKFSSKERDLISSLFTSPHGTTQLPPGLAKNLKRGKPLPPGWQKKLNPGYRVEDQIFNAFTPVPYSMFPSYKPVPNTRLYYHDNKVIRLMDATREIIDVISLP